MTRKSWIVHTRLKTFVILCLDNASGVNEVLAVVVMLLHAGGDGENVRVEDDVVGIEADLLREDAIRPRTDLHLAGGKKEVSSLTDRIRIHRI
jgi:hypothetical protein